MLNVSDSFIFETYNHCLKLSNTNLSKQCVKIWFQSKTSLTHIVEFIVILLYLVKPSKCIFLKMQRPYALVSRYKSAKNGISGKAMLQLKTMPQLAPQPRINFSYHTSSVMLLNLVKNAVYLGFKCLTNWSEDVSFILKDVEYFLFFYI